MEYGIDATRQIMLSGWGEEAFALHPAALLVFGLATMTFASITLGRVKDARPRA
ncbi:MAG TPA: hypothetical protein VJN63_04960 [Thermoplasmata archaeon]|nr:hypothetical protein [Thermoplasmata archaeon]